MKHYETFLEAVKAIKYKLYKHSGLAVDILISYMYKEKNIFYGFLFLLGAV